MVRAHFIGGPFDGHSKIIEVQTPYYKALKPIRPRPIDTIHMHEDVACEVIEYTRISRDIDVEGQQYKSIIYAHIRK